MTPLSRDALCSPDSRLGVLVFGRYAPGLFGAMGGVANQNAVAIAATPAAHAKRVAKVGRLPGAGYLLGCLKDY